MKKICYIVFLLIISNIVLTACGKNVATAPAPSDAQSTELTVSEGHIMPITDIKLFFPVKGKVKEILVKEGQSVKAGDTLINLDDDQQAQALLTTAKLDYIDAQQAYDKFIRTTDIASAQAFQEYQKAQINRAEAQLLWEAINPNQINDDIDVAKADVEDYKKALNDANDTLDKYKNLKPDNATRRNAEDDVRKAEADYNTAVRKVEELQRKIDEPKAQLDKALAEEAESKRNYENTIDSAPDPDKKALLEARLNNSKAQLATAQKAVDNFSLQAPFSGEITDINLAIGELAGSDKYAIQMADTSEWIVETSDLNELEVVNVSVGQSVEVIPDAIADITLTGNVESISQSYKSQGGDILYTVKIKLTDTDPRLRWGMTVQVTFLQGTE